MAVITFKPIYQKRVWGGRNLEKIYQRQLPDTTNPYGESWEISARPGADSIVLGGTYKGQSLDSLWAHHRSRIFGNYSQKKFPLLIKILDAQQDLSIQVHPPENIARLLKAEAKTEMWYVAHAEKDAKIYVGLKKGTTRQSFEVALNNGNPDKLVHAIKPNVGESIHIPSGRVHAIGAGLVIYEIQQNSDSTYRVFDWNRLGLDGNARKLHIKESMQCIDFDDIEPSMDAPIGNVLAECAHYRVEKIHLSENEYISNPHIDRFSIVTVVKGNLVDSNNHNYNAGRFILNPIGSREMQASEESIILQTTLPY